MATPDPIAARERDDGRTPDKETGDSLAAYRYLPHVSRWRLLWNRLQAKLHHAYPCRVCGYAYNCPDGECHS